MRAQPKAYVLGAAVALAALPAFAQTPTRPPAAAPAIPPLSPAQQAAALLGRWETCVDLAAQFLAKSARSADRAAANAERRCVEFESRMRPVLAQSLQEMMYGSSEQQVAEQTRVAIEALRRHIRARAVAAVNKARAG